MNTETEKEFFMKYFKKLDLENKTLSRQNRHKWHCTECGDSFRQIIVTGKERGGGRNHLFKKHKICFEEESVKNNKSNIDEETVKYKKKNEELVDNIISKQNEDLEVEKGIYEVLLAYKRRQDAEYDDDDDENETMDVQPSLVKTLINNFENITYMNNDGFLTFNQD